jgi:CRP-like cAMP-binding protein
MATLLPFSKPSENHLLARLPQDQYPRLFSLLRPVPLPFKEVLYQPGEAIQYAYFPNRGVLSALTLMEDGASIECGSVGYEGMVVLSATFEVETAANQVIVQIEGDGQRIEAAALQEEARREGPLGRLLQRHHSAFQRQVSQSVACNGLHKVQQRCCRWLLLTHDRVEGDVLGLTHEFLGVMLGVRRASVTEVLRPLQEQGLLRSHRSAITILDRPGLEAAACECYRAVAQAYRQLLG